MNRYLRIGAFVALLISLSSRSAVAEDYNGYNDYYEENYGDDNVNDGGNNNGNDDAVQGYNDNYGYNQNDDAIQYWTNYAILPKRCIV